MAPLESVLPAYPGTAHYASLKGPMLALVSGFSCLLLLGAISSVPHQRPSPVGDHTSLRNVIHIP